MDYAQLLARAQEERATAEERLRRVELLSKRGKEAKETGLLRHHREAWEREHSRLLAAKKVHTNSFLLCSRNSCLLFCCIKAQLCTRGSVFCA